MLWELIKSICRDLQRDWHVIFMSFSCGYSKVTLSSFISFLWFQSLAPQLTPTPPIWSPFGCSDSTSTFARILLFQLRPPLSFPKRELHFHIRAALFAGIATPSSSQQATSFKGWLQTFLTSKTSEIIWTLCDVKYYEKLKDQTPSFEPSAVNRKAIWSLLC